MEILLCRTKGMMMVRIEVNVQDLNFLWSVEIKHRKEIDMTKDFEFAEICITS